MNHDPRAATVLGHNPGKTLRALDQAGLVVTDATRLTIDRSEQDDALCALSDALGVLVDVLPYLPEDRRRAAEARLRLARYVAASDTYKALRERYEASREREWRDQITKGAA